MIDCIFITISNSCIQKDNTLNFMTKRMPRFLRLCAPFIAAFIAMSGAAHTV